MKTIKASLATLQRVITPKPTQNKPPESTPAAPQTGAKGKNQPLTFLKAAASPPHPSIVVSLPGISWPEGKPSPAELCAGINGALEASETDQTHVSGATGPQGTT